MVKKETRNRGVDVILNSSVDDKFLASIRCLAPGGNFLEIGQFNLINQSLGFLRKEAGFHGVVLNQFTTLAPVEKTILNKLISEGIQKGFIVPLPRKIFQKYEVEKAFKYLMAEKHVGKVLIAIRDNYEQTNEEVITPKTIKAEPR